MTENPAATLLCTFSVLLHCRRGSLLVELLTAPGQRYTIPASNLHQTVYTSAADPASSDSCIHGVVMDVPFISSGAMSRAQYGLVRKIENAASPQATDQIILNELNSIRRDLQQPHLSIVRDAS